MDKYGIPHIGRWLLSKEVAREGGEKTSSLLRKRVWQQHHVDVGMYSYGGCFDPSFNIGGTGVTVGRYCSIAQNVSYYGASHPVNHAVMSPWFYNRAFSGLDVEDVKRHHLEIGNDVWIGSNVIITQACRSIGNGAVIGGVNCDP